MVLLAACAVIFIMHEAYAQQQLAEPAVNENINAELNSNGIAYITHEVFNKQLDSPVALIDGTVSEIRVTDMEGNAIEYTFSNSDGTIYVEDGNDYAIIKYKLEDALLKENGAWVWASLHPVKDNHFHLSLVLQSHLQSPYHQLPHQTPYTGDPKMHYLSSL